MIAIRLLGTRSQLIVTAFRQFKMSRDTIAANSDSYSAPITSRDTIAANSDSYSPIRVLIAANSDSLRYSSSPIRDMFADNSDSYSPIRDTIAANKDSYSRIRDTIAANSDAICLFWKRSLLIVTAAELFAYY